MAIDDGCLGYREVDCAQMRFGNYSESPPKCNIFGIELHMSSRQGGAIGGAVADTRQAARGPHPGREALQRKGLRTDGPHHRGSAEKDAGKRAGQ